MAKVPIPAVPQLATKFDAFQTHDLGGGYVTVNIDSDVKPNQLTAGRNVDVNGNSVEKRRGHVVYGSVTGFTTATLSLFTHEPPGGTAEFLRVYDTVMERYVAGTWTALTSVTMTTNLPADSAFFPLTNKTYVLNGTDNVVKYTSGSSGDQTDASFKKGKYLCHYKNRLIVAGVSGQESYFWYTDLGVDTFSSSNYVRVEGAITGLKVLYDKLVILTKDTIYTCSNFTFNGVAAGPESVLPLRGKIGCIAHRTWSVVGPIAYFLGLSSEGTAAVWATDGLTISNDPISLPIYSDFNALSANLLTNACAGQYGRYYRISVTPSGASANTLEYLYDTVGRRWSPPYSNGVGGFSCYASYTSGGTKYLAAGSQYAGMTYQLNQADYDENPTERHTDSGSLDTAVDANPAKRGAQSFRLSTGENTSSVAINSILVKLKKNAGTTTGLTVRIETDNGGAPSGTLAHASATGTIPAITSTSYAYYSVSMTGTTLVKGITYWIVVRHTTEGSGNSQYYWGGVSSSPTYSRGNIATYSTGINSFTQTFLATHAGSGGVTRFPHTSESFSTLRSGAGTQTVGIGGAYLEADGTGNNDLYSTLVRGVYQFDTSSLPDDAVISAATVSLYVSFVRNNLSQSDNLTSAAPASTAALSASDYNIASFGSTRFTTDTSISGRNTNAYNDYVLNSSGRAAISVTGYTKMGHRFASDIDNSAPTWSASLASDIEVDVTTNLPKLVVTYTTVGGVAGWVADTAKDQNFALFQQADIDGYADTASLYITPIGQKYHLRDLFVDAKASGAYSIQVGVNNGDYGSFQFLDMSVSNSGPVFGSTLVIGSSVLGGQLRNEQRLRFDAIRGYLLKVRFRNRFANQPFKIYGFRTRHEVLPKIR